MAVWPLAAGFAAVTVVLYVAARTVGLLAYKPSDWSDPRYGVTALIVEALLVVMYLVSRVAGTRDRGRAPSKAHSPRAAAL